MRKIRTILCVLLGGYMLVDGLHALLTGEYLVATSGEFAGRLGPWATLLSDAHVDPHAQLCKMCILLLGLIWLFHAWRVYSKRALFVPTLVLCVITFWYAPFGTAIAMFEIICTLAKRARPAVPAA